MTTETTKEAIARITEETRQRINHAADIAKLCRASADVLLEEMKMDSPTGELLRDASGAILKLLQICAMFGQAVDLAARENVRLIGEVEELKTKNRELREYLE